MSNVPERIWMSRDAEGEFLWDWDDCRTGPLDVEYVIASKLEETEAERDLERNDRVASEFKMLELRELLRERSELYVTTADEIDSQRLTIKKFIASDKVVRSQRDLLLEEKQRLVSRLTTAQEQAEAMTKGLVKSSAIRIDLEQRLAAAEAENTRLSGMKAPTGALSHEQQARAWEYVWDSLWNMGMCSFLPDPCTGKSQNRVVQFVGDAIRQLKEAKATLDEMSPKIWNIAIVSPTPDDPFRKVDCEIIDVGYSDHVIVIAVKEVE